MASTAQKALKGAFSSLASQMEAGLTEDRDIAKEERMSARQRRMEGLRNDYATGRLNLQLSAQETLADKAATAQEEKEGRRANEQKIRDERMHEQAITLAQEKNPAMQELRLRGVKPQSEDGKKLLAQLLEAQRQDTANVPAKVATSEYYRENVLEGSDTPEAYRRAFQMSENKESTVASVAKAMIDAQSRDDIRPGDKQYKSPKQIVDEAWAIFESARSRGDEDFAKKQPGYSGMDIQGSGLQPIKNFYNQ